MTKRERQVALVTPFLRPREMTAATHTRKTTHSPTALRKEVLQEGAPLLNPENKQEQHLGVIAIAGPSSQ